MPKNNQLIGNDIAIVNQILPHKEKWAWDLFLTSMKNFWSPVDIGMGKDIEQWHNGQLTEEEKLVVKRCLGFFAGSESLVANNLLLNIFKYVCDPECRMFISIQQQQESVHNLTVVYCVDSLGLDINEIYEAYQSIPTIAAKDSFLMRITKDINRKSFDIETPEGKEELVRNIVTYFIICESILFYTGFAALLSFKRRNLLPGITQQIEYVLKDERNHVEFGLQLLARISQEYPYLWTGKIKNEIGSWIVEAVNLEVDFAKEMLPNGVMGLNQDNFIKYAKFLGNLRCHQLGLPQFFESVENVFPWMGETIEVDKLKNFFESTVTSYQKGNIVDDL